MSKKHKDITVDGKRYRLTQMSAQDALWVFGLSMQRNITLAEKREAHQERQSLALAQVSLLSDVKGKEVPIPVCDGDGNPIPAIIDDVLLLAKLVKESITYSVNDPLAAGLQDSPAADPAS